MVQPPQNPGLLAALASSLNSPQQQTVSGGQPAQTYAPQGLGDTDLSLLSGFTPQSMVPSSSPSAQQPQTNAPIMVTAAKHPLNVPLSQLDNSQEVNTDHNIINQYGQGTQPPRSIHGTLGAILGHLGDAFLVGSGRQPEYLPRMQQQQVGNAMAGFENNPGAAASRVAATGAPGSSQLAASLNEQANEMKLRQQIQEQNNSYRQSLIQNRNDQATQRMLPYIGNLVQQAKTPEDYQRVYSQADAMAKRLDPDSDASVAFGLVSPEEWQPGMNQNAGMTANQSARIETTQRGQNMTQQNAQTGARARLGAANIMANAHLKGIQPSETGYLSDLINKQNQGQTLTPAEQMYFNHFTAPPHNAKTQTAPGVPIQNYGANNPVANAGKPVTPEQARTLPKGTHFLTSDGRWLVR